MHVLAQVDTVWPGYIQSSMFIHDETFTVHAFVTPCALNGVSDDITAKHCIQTPACLPPQELSAATTLPYELPIALSPPRPPGTVLITPSPSSPPSPSPSPSQSSSTSPSAAQSCLILHVCLASYYMSGLNARLSTHSCHPAHHHHMLTPLPQPPPLQSRPACQTHPVRPPCPARCAATCATPAPPAPPPAGAVPPLRQYPVYSLL